MGVEMNRSVNGGSRIVVRDDGLLVLPRDFQTAAIVISTGGHSFSSVVKIPVCLPADLHDMGRYFKKGGYKFAGRFMVACNLLV